VPKGPAGQDDAFPIQSGQIESTVLALIIKEVPMFRKNRLQPGFDSLESVVLLSTGMATASSPAHLDSFFGERLELNGTLHGNKTDLVVDAQNPPAAETQIKGGALSHFDTSGRLSTLGKVSGSFGPNQATDAPLGQLPNLSNLTLELSNHSGSVQLALSPSTTNEYRFTMSGGSGSYAVAYGSGSLTINFRQSSNEYLLRLQSAS
jgi:hypothetical protein